VDCRAVGNGCETLVKKDFIIIHCFRVQNGMRPWNRGGIFRSVVSPSISLAFFKFLLDGFVVVAVFHRVMEGDVMGFDSALVGHDGCMAVLTNFKGSIGTVYMYTYM